MDDLICFSSPKFPGAVKHVTNAKIAVYAGGLDLPKTETKGTVLLKSADELETFSKGEEKRYEDVRVTHSIMIAWGGCN
jgi:chaperonin GroEL (HSP60 family)